MRQQEFELKQQQALKRIEGAAKTSGPQSLTQINNNTYNITSKDLLQKVMEEVDDDDCITDPKDLPTYDFS